MADELPTTSEARFEALVVRQSRFVFGVAYAILRNPDDSEDVVQETFLKLYRSRSWGSDRERARISGTCRLEDCRGPPGVPGPERRRFAR